MGGLQGLDGWTTGARWVDYRGKMGGLQGLDGGTTGARWVDYGG